ncbi:MAG TPA: M48 family metallopeptidase [Burkholderiales bacterium]|nr:M48 family metallopeptidase [Burkholderiales bacterium]
MNFFEHQDQARKSTRLMIMLYVVAVIGVVTAVTIALAIAWYWAVDERPPAGFYPWAAIGTLGTIVIASLYHIVRLREGGEAIARLVGAQRVAPGTRDPLERRLLNVVEEMAIAAGTRVPAVFVMQGETGINAFAAGYDVSNAVVAVTRGALQTLNRDELQAVVAHEFSHIVNGDMWLNIRMMGVLGGIVFIGAIGEFIMRSQGQSRSRRDSGSGGVFAFGLALMAIGYIGLFFARLIKAAVSRQREFLADASSVQFTRNPTGIAGALDQIRASAGGTLIANRYAEDMSHMFFGQAVKVWLGGMLDTHPPIDERIRRVLPSFGATEYRRGRVSAAVADGEGAPARATEASGKRASDQAHAWGRSVAQSVALAGALEAGKMDYARALIQRVPQQLRDALHKKDSAPAVVVALLLAPMAEVMEQQLAAARAGGAGKLADAAGALAPAATGLGAEFRLPLIDLALPSLKELPEESKAELLRAIEAVIQADRRVSLHEFVVLTLVRLQLDRTSVKADKSIVQSRAEIALLLSLMSHAGNRPEVAERAFLAGTKQLGLGDLALADRKSLDLANAGQALDKLRALAPLAKGELLGALFAAVTADGRIRIAEAELMRLVSAALSVPLPPMLTQIDPVTLAP